MTVAYVRPLQPPRIEDFSPQEDAALNCLEYQACACQAATKIVGCALCPIALIGCCLQLVCEDIFGKDGPCVDQSLSLPPKNHRALICRFTDPYICWDVISCKKEPACNYLPPEKQQMWTSLHEKWLVTAPRVSVSRALFPLRQNGFEPRIVDLVLEYAREIPPGRLLGIPRS